MTETTRQAEFTSIEDLFFISVKVYYTPQRRTHQPNMTDGSFGKNGAIAATPAR